MSDTLQTGKSEVLWSKMGYYADFDISEIIFFAFLFQIWPVDLPDLFIVVVLSIDKKIVFFLMIFSLSSQNHKLCVEGIKLALKLVVM